jgi:hypothetical protein
MHHQQELSQTAFKLRHTAQSSWRGLCCARGCAMVHMAGLFYGQQGLCPSCPFLLCCAGPCCAVAPCTVGVICTLRSWRFGARSVCAATAIYAILMVA